MQKAVDLSEHNGNFNLQMLKDNGIKGVILRLCWLGNHNNHTKDKQIENYYKQAKALGLNIGFYAYSYCETIDALKSGLIYIDHLLEDLGVPNGHTIFLDLEDSQISKLSKSELTNQAEYFCNYYILRGYKSGVYANANWFKNKLDVNKLLNYKIWLAQWDVKKPTVSFKVDVWQYTDKLYINNKRFDGNECYCDNCNNDDNGGDFEMKVYQNGSTPEIVYQDSGCTKQIGYLHPKEQATCYGIVDNKALIVYTIDGTNNLKSGFVKWLGGIK
jgi:hypothetical protein